MRIISLTILSLMVSISVFSQGPYAGLRAGGASTWLLNGYVFDKGGVQDIAPAFGFNAGMVGGYYFTKGLGAEVNFLINSHNMKYTGKDGSVSYTSQTNLKMLDIPIMLKVGSTVYFEIGPMFSFVTGATYTETHSGKTTPKDVSPFFSGMNTSLALGFGGNIEVTKKLLINIGMRLAYGFTDLGGVDALGTDKGTLRALRDPDIARFKTNTAAGGINLGVTYKF